MYIKELTIKNFRCFGSEGISINFNKELTAFIGKNGSGKTAILEAINLVFGQESVVNKINEIDFNEEAIGIKDEIVIEAVTVNPFFIEVDVISDTFQSNIVLVPCNKVTLTIKRRERADKVLDEPYIVTKTLTPLLGSIDEEIYTVIKRGKKYTTKEINMIKSDVKTLEEARKIIKDLLIGTVEDIEKYEDYYTVTYRLKSKEIRTASFSNYEFHFNQNRIIKFPKSYYLSKDRVEEVMGSYSLISKILTDMHWRYKKKVVDGEKEIKEKYNELAQLLRIQVDEKGMLIDSIKDKVAEIAYEITDFKIDFINTNQPYKAAFVSLNIGNKILYPDNLGSGYTILLAFALYSYVAKKEKIPIIFLVDEPELHLHSDWQTNLYNAFLKEKSLQIIYTTHSDSFISLKNWNEIRSIKNFKEFPIRADLYRVVDSVTGEIVIDYINDYAKRNFNLSVFHRENLEIFFTLKCILVEGPAEKYALPKLLSIFGCNIGQYSVSIIPCWGKYKIKLYQRICQCFHIPFYTIWDKDGTDKQNEEENALIFSNVSDKNYSEFTTSFEKLFNINGKHNMKDLVEIVDRINNKNDLSEEIKTAVDNIVKFIIE